MTFKDKQETICVGVYGGKDRVSMNARNVWNGSRLCENYFLDAETKF